MISMFRSRIARLVIAGLVALGASAGLAAAEKTLYDRLGGKPALEAVVGELWNITKKDDRINKYFANTKPEAFASQLVDFLCQASGGPCQYKGKDMKTTHTGMHLTEADFNALAEDTAKALDKFKVPAGEKNEVIGLLASLKGDVINR
jgi:hemoglobin